MDMNQIDAAIRERIEHTYQVAEQRYGRTFTRPSLITYNVRGKVAGKAYTRTGQIDFNKQILLENLDTFINRTPGHEAAHLIAFQLCGVADHGPVWRQVMLRTGQAPIRCHSFVVKTPYEYVCGCDTIHYFTKNRHTRVIGGTVYSCRICKQQMRKKCCELNLIPV